MTNTPRPSGDRHLTVHTPSVVVIPGTAEGRLAAAHESEVREGRRLYQTMFDRGPLAQLAVDFPSFRINVVNKAMCTMTGFTADELIGQNVAIIFPLGESPQVDASKRVADADIEGYAAQRLLQCRDGTVIPFLATVSVLRDEGGAPVQLLMLARDLSEQRIEEVKQRRSQALLDAAIATLPVAFSTFDTNLRLTFVGGGRERGGTLAEENLGKHISAISDEPIAVAAVRAALAGADTSSRTLVNGSTYLAVNAPMRDECGVIVGVISVSTDISVEVGAEDARRRSEEQARFVAEHDALTGLPGRATLVRHLETLAESGRCAGALLLLDLDDFNIINDSLGHDVGDGVIVEVARRVSAIFPDLMVARYGGDEFAVVAPLPVTFNEAVEAAERVHGALEPDIEVGGQLLRVTASVGLALEQTRGVSSTLIRNADSALSHAKSEGAGLYRLYDDDMRTEVQNRVALQAGLREALRVGRLRVAYQPIVGLADRVMVGSEALLRWTDAKRGAVPPAEFIPVAEQSGLILPIGAWVMNAACRDTLALHRTHGTYVSVNVSARQLSGGGFAERVMEVLERNGLPPQALTIEVTESSMMDDIGPIRSAFDELRSQGIQVSIDDFGTGYSSLAQLQRLPVDVIKLDRAFVTGVDERPEARAMALAILQLSVAIGASIVAEGVETEPEAAALLDLGYTLAQGYLFGRPMPIEALMARTLSG